VYWTTRTLENQYCTVKRCRCVTVTILWSSRWTRPVFMDRNLDFDSELWIGMCIGYTLNEHSKINIVLLSDVDAWRYGVLWSSRCTRLIKWSIFNGTTIDLWKTYASTLSFRLALLLIAFLWNLQCYSLLSSDSFNIAQLAVLLWGFMDEKENKSRVIALFASSYYSVLS
jgi:hypothetical protein